MTAVIGRPPVRAAGDAAARPRSRARDVFVFTLARCAGAAPKDAAWLATSASGIVVRQLGTATPSELIADFEGNG